MVERTIQHYARELAGIFYDFVRSAEDADFKVQVSQRGHVLLQIDPKAFGKTFPTVKDYLAGRRHGRTEPLPDGTVKFVPFTEWSALYDRCPICNKLVIEDTPGWLHWVDPARQHMTEMLGRSDVHENIKRGIYEALIEDREKQLEQEARGQQGPNITQRKLH
jgi:hypothetical protein